MTSLEAGQVGVPGASPQCRCGWWRRSTIADVPRRSALSSVPPARTGQVGRGASLRLRPLEFLVPQGHSRCTFPVIQPKIQEKLVLSGAYA
jgi:hypothetical protein